GAGRRGRRSRADGIAMLHAEPIRALLDRVRARWRLARALEAMRGAALVSAAIVGAALVAARVARPVPVALSLVFLAAIILAIAAIVAAVRPLARQPSDAQVARFIEERDLGLDDRLVTAVDALRSDLAASSSLVEPLLADAAARAREVGLDDV